MREPSAGCAPRMRTAGFFSFRKRDTPVIVPVVPIALTKCVMLAVGVVPDLGAGGLVVDARVVGVGELVEHPALAVGLHLQREVARVFHAARLAA